MSSRSARSLDPSYFTRKYANDPDPWRFASSTYEREKYAASLATLRSGRYRNALEVGCSIGVLTRKLADHCDRLVAVDAARPALNQARERCVGLTNVSFAEAYVPRDWPEGIFDLVVLSEVLYYLNESDLRTLVTCVERSCSPDASLLLVHWTGLTDYPLSGDAAANLFIRETRHFAKVTLQRRTVQYRLDRLECNY